AININANKNIRQVC
ncbi:TPA: DUF5445 family protein, partial [Escherichia coli]|nr:DUF5445 family protein [Escherichia coli]